MTQPRKITHLSFLIGALLLVTLSSTCKADSLFNGPYDAANWTTTWTNSDGAVDTSQAPDYVVLAGGNNGSGLPGEVLFSIVAPSNTTLAFNWTYLTFDADGSAFDPAGYEIDGVHFQLSPPSSEFGFLGSGVNSVDLSAGQSFGFYVDSTDNDFGPAILQVSGADSTPVPEPSSLLLLGAGMLALCALGFWHRKHNVQTYQAISAA